MAECDVVDSDIRERRDVATGAVADDVVAASFRWHFSALLRLRVLVPFCGRVGPLVHCAVCFLLHCSAVLTIPCNNFVLFYFVRFFSSIKP